MKRVFSWLMVCSMLLSLMTFPATAVGEGKVWLDKDVSVKPGENVTLDLHLEKNPGICALSIFVKYPAELTCSGTPSVDKDKSGADTIWKAFKTAQGDKDGGYTFQEVRRNDTANSRAALAYTVNPPTEDGYPEVPLSTNGIIASIPFKASETITAPTDVQLEIQVTSATGENSAKVTVASENCTVHIVPESAPADVAISYKATPTAGGTVTGAATAKAGDEVTVTANAANGYKLVKVTANGAEVTGGKFTVPSGVTAVEVEATFEKIENVQVSFNTNGGSTIPSITVPKGGTVNKPADPTRTGSYTFAGWFTASTGGQAVTFPLTVSDNTTVYAHWNVSTDVSPEAPSFVVSNATGKPGDTVEVTVEMKNNPGVDRVGFNVEFPEQLELTEKPTASTMLPAINFRENDYSSPYPVLMGENASQTEVAPAGTNGVILTLKFKVKDDAPENSYPVTLTNQRGFAHDLTRVTFEAVNGSVTVQKPAQVTVTFNTNGGSTIDPVTVDKGGTVNKPADPTRTGGYTFAGWFTASTGGQAVTFPLTVNENTTVYAQWTQAADTAVVTFETNGGSTIDPVNVKKGGAVNEPTAPTRDGYTFDGWFTDPALTQEVTFPFTVNDNITLYAKWQGDSASQNGCYIATSVYGSYDTPEVWTLRRFRDDVLGQTWYGRLFIKAYYATSPTLVRLFGNADWFRNFWRDKLDTLVQSLQDDGFESTPYQDKDW